MPTSSAGDGWNHQHLVALLKVVFLVAQEANILFVDIKIDKSPYLPVLSTQVCPQCRKTVFDLGDQLRQIGRGAGHLARVIGVLLKGIGQQDSNGPSCRRWGGWWCCGVLMRSCGRGRGR